MSERTNGKISFFSKEEIKCPICREKFHREELFQGRGRINAGDLDHELRRSYIPSEKYGVINPLFYSITVCPYCFFAARKEDFDQIVNPKNKKWFEDSYEVREKYLHILKDQEDISFEKPRNLTSAIASYLLATSVYSGVDLSFNPTIKKGINLLRAAWLTQDWYDHDHRKEIKELENVFYRRAAFFYSKAVGTEILHKEPLYDSFNYGPDTDNNFGIDGAFYIASYLNYKLLKESKQDKSPDKIDTLRHIRQMLSRLFGIGKVSKKKPAVFLEVAKTMYQEISSTIDNWERESSLLKAEGEEGES